MAHFSTVRQMEQSKKIIMGIDPGTNRTGYGILEVGGRKPRAVVIGDIDLHKLNDPYDKLAYIFKRVGALIDEYQPDEVALESPFFGENVQSMLKLGPEKTGLGGLSMCRARQSHHLIIIHFFYCRFQGNTSSPIIIVCILLPLY